MPMWADMGFTLSGLKLVEDMENTQVKHIKMITQGCRNLLRKAEPLFTEDMDWTLEDENSVPCRARVETLQQEQDVQSPWSRKEQRRPVRFRCSKPRRSHWEVRCSGHGAPPPPQLGAHTWSTRNWKPLLGFNKGMYLVYVLKSSLWQLSENLILGEQEQEAENPAQSLCDIQKGDGIKYEEKQTRLRHKREHEEHLRMDWVRGWHRGGTKQSRLPDRGRPRRGKPRPKILTPVTVWWPYV